VKKAEGLERKIAEFKEDVFESFPYLVEQAITLGSIPIGSGYNGTRNTDPEFRRFCEYELDLRVGLGHELLQDLRTSVSISHRFNLEQKDTWGVDLTDEITRSQKKASTRTSRGASDYIHNWRKIQAILGFGFIPENDHTSRLKGLQKLETQKDLKYFKVAGQQTQNYMDPIKEDISWIWHVPMLGLNASSDPAGIQKALNEWIDECEIPHLPIPRCSMQLLTPCTSTTTEMGSYICKP
jgi:hypothetical protein